MADPVFCLNPLNGWSFQQGRRQMGWIWMALLIKAGGFLLVWAVAAGGCPSIREGAVL